MPFRSLVSRRTAWFLWFGVAFSLLVGFGLDPSLRTVRAGSDADPQSLLGERRRLSMENASLGARLSLAKDPSPYLVADLSARMLFLELQGVPLTSLPIRNVRLNEHAHRLLDGSDRASLLETPFTLAEDRWFEVAKTLALKDSSAIRSRPDTTGALMEAIQTSPVTALLSFDKRLNLVLEGKIPKTGWAAIRERITAWLQSWSSGTLEGILRRQSADEVMVTLALSPADIRSLAPNLTEGTKLVLVY